MKRNHPDGATDGQSGSSQLDQLKTMTVVVADTGEFQQIPQYKPRDVTTNPSLVFKATQVAEYSHFLPQAVEYAIAASSDPETRVSLALDKLSVLLGVEVLKLVEGRVSTEVDARLSYDIEGSVARVKQLKKLYEEHGINTEKRVLFKLASTWEGIKAAEILEKENIHCNLTLLFCMAQAVACAEANVTLISPFVGRILDYWKKETGKTYPVEEDPGVVSVTKIYNYYKEHQYKTIVMGASFRSKDEALGLAGCDYLTLAPSILDELSKSKEPVQRKLSPENVKPAAKKPVPMAQKDFLWAFCQDPCAVTKLAEGIRGFTADIEKLEKTVRSQLQGK